MSMKEKGYAVWWAAVGVAKPSKTIAFLRERRQADREWRQSRPEKLAGLGTVSHLSVLPLIDYYPGDGRLTGGRLTGGRLAGEPGVSYLVTVDGKRILFDLGLNKGREHPSPLLRNMEALGVSVADLDAVFISHIHLDHVGGVEEMRQRTFALSAQPVDMGGIPAYAPAPMSHPSARVEVVSEPRKLAEGVASTGPLTRAIWLMGPVVEQSLLVNVEGKGVVMIVGCGHPSLERLLERAQAVTGAPLHGVIGGLHFPVTGSRVGKGGQNILGNGKLPWQRITRREAQEAVAQLAALDLGLVALSAHDSCDWTLGVFAETLGERCRTVKVGEEIVVA